MRPPICVISSSVGRGLPEASTTTNSPPTGKTCSAISRTASRHCGQPRIVAISAVIGTVSVVMLPPRTARRSMDTPAAASWTAKIAEPFADRVGEVEHGDERRAAHNLSLDLGLVVGETNRAHGPPTGDPHWSDEPRPVGCGHATSAQAADHPAVVEHQRCRRAHVRRLEMRYPGPIRGDDLVAHLAQRGDVTKLEGQRAG